MSKATAKIGKGGYKTEITTGSNHKIIADEPEGNGGTNLGASPTEYLSSALAACTAITLRMYADRKQWNLEELDINIELNEGDRENKPAIKRTLTFKGNLDEQQKERLLQIANLCPVHKLLSQPLEIETTMD